MSRKERGFNMWIEKAGRIFAPALFLLNLPVALARVPGKIANQAEAVAHVWCQSYPKWQVGRPKKCCKCLLVAESHIGLQTDLTKKRRKEEYWQHWVIISTGTIGAMMVWVMRVHSKTAAVIDDSFSFKQMTQKKCFCTQVCAYRQILPAQE